MTTATAGRPLGAGGWGRLAWPAWRPHRAALTALAVLSVVLAAVMLAAALLGQAHYATLVRDHCLSGDVQVRCGPPAAGFPRLDISYYPVAVALAAWILPVLAAVFLGAPLLAREYERGTARFTWTQGTSRTSWLLASLATLAVPVVAGAAVLGALAEWSLQPFEAMAVASRWKEFFDATPLTLAAWALFALLLGVAAGAVLRRVVPAMAVAGGAVAALVLVNAYQLHDVLLNTGAILTRVRLLAPQAYPPAVNADRFFFILPVAGVRSGSWIVDGWVRNRNGHRMTDPAIDRLWSSEKPQAWLASQHATAWIRYQPGGHFWALQGLETGVLLALALALAAATVVLIRRSST